MLFNLLYLCRWNVTPIKDMIYLADGNQQSRCLWGYLFCCKSLWHKKTPSSGLRHRWLSLTQGRVTNMPSPSLFSAFITCNITVSFQWAVSSINCINLKLNLLMLTSRLLGVLFWMLSSVRIYNLWPNIRFREDVCEGQSLLSCRESLLWAL